MEYEIATDESASLAVVRALAAYTETQPSELEPLYERVDPDALNTVIHGAERSVRVRFEYEGAAVTVSPVRVVVTENTETNG